jgi:mannose-1-phosphate guanylyltransferase
VKILHGAQRRGKAKPADAAVAFGTRSASDARMPTLWPIVLAGGSGRRLASVTGATPKQFWSLGTRPSLLEETMARVAPLAPATRTTVIVDRSHAPYLHTRAWQAGRILYQPCNRGTAPGVLLALTPAFEATPDAIVLVTPSDHGIVRPAHFHVGIHEAASAVEPGAVDLVLFGVVPSEPSTDYGWITRGGLYDPSTGQRLRHLAGFVEKPSATRARRLFEVRALWNTMIVVGRARALVRLYETWLPPLAGLFSQYVGLPHAQRDAFLADQYARLPASDFSRDVLTPARGLAVYTWPASIGWSDLGTPERLRRWIGPRSTPCVA